MADEVAEAAETEAENNQIAVESANSTLDLFSIVPVEIWLLIATAVIGAVGWFGRTAFDAWQKSRLPFKQDRERYQAVVDALDPSHLHYFKETSLSAIGSRAIDGIDDAYDSLTSIQRSKPKYLHKTLQPLEDELFISLGELNAFLPLKLFPHQANGHIYTMYWDQFDEWSDEHNKRFQVIEDELVQKINRSISAYEAYRDAGNKLFADRLVKEKSHG